MLKGGLPEYSLPPIPEEERRGLLTANLLSLDAWAAGNLDIRIEESGDFFDRGLTWSVSAEGGSGDYLYGFFVVKGREENGTLNYYQAPNGKQAATSYEEYTYIFPENGKYQLWVDVYDLEDHTKTRKVFPYTVEVEGRDPLDFTVEMTGTPFNGPLTWTVNVTGGSGQYACSLCLSFPECAFGNDDAITYKRKDRPGNTLSYELLMSGDYVLKVWVRDGNDSAWKYKQYPYSFHSPDHPSLQARIDEIAAQCRASGCATDYQKALWLHDWLTGNADYDFNYAHYGPDGVLLAGTGVCDSYSKAFALLAQAIGLQAERVENVAHAWNAVRIDGNWSYLDITWDDPGPGQEFHLYFGIPYEILRINHQNFNGRFGCTGYQDSYYYREPEFGLTWGKALADAVQAGLAEGVFDFSIQLPDTYDAEGHTFSDRNTPGAALADYLAILFVQGCVYSFDGKPVELLLEKEILKNNYYVEASVDVAGKVLTVPDDAVFIEEEAFMGNRAVRFVILSDTLMEVGDRAFAGCDDLWAVTVYSSDAVFGSDVFDTDNRHLSLLVFQGSTAEAYAMAHGLKYSYLDPEALDEPDIPVPPDPR